MLMEIISHTCCWNSLLERTEKIPLGSIRQVLSEPIKGQEEYHIMVSIPYSLPFYSVNISWVCLIVFICSVSSYPTGTTARSHRTVQILAVLDSCSVRGGNQRCHFRKVAVLLTHKHSNSRLWISEAYQRRMMMIASLFIFFHVYRHKIYTQNKQFEK